jgi:yeast amino acid transporter
MATSQDKNYDTKPDIRSLSDDSPTNGVVDAYTAPLHRRLKSRHLQMIAIGGIIGPGLLVGSGNALHLAGPAGILISFSLVGIIVYFVM